MQRGPRAVSRSRPQPENFAGRRDAAVRRRRLRAARADGRSAEDAAAGGGARRPDGLSRAGRGAGGGGRRGRRGGRRRTRGGGQRGAQTSLSSRLPGKRQRRAGCARERRAEDESLRLGALCRRRRRFFFFLIFFSPLLPPFLFISLSFDGFFNPSLHRRLSDPRAAETRKTRAGAGMTLGPAAPSRSPNPGRTRPPLPPPRPPYPAPPPAARPRSVPGRGALRL